MGFTVLPKFCEFNTVFTRKKFILKVTAALFGAHSTIVCVSKEVCLQFFTACKLLNYLCVNMNGF